MMEIRDEKLLLKGKWYLCAIPAADAEINWPCSPIYKYVGEGLWADDQGDEASMYDPVMGEWVSPHLADAWKPIIG